MIEGRHVSKKESFCILTTYSLSRTIMRVDLCIEIEQVVDSSRGKCANQRSEVFWMEVKAAFPS